MFVQGYDGVDLEMNMNGNKFSLQDDDGFSDMVSCLMKPIGICYFI